MSALAGRFPRRRGAAEKTVLIMGGIAALLMFMAVMGVMLTLQTASQPAPEAKDRVLLFFTDDNAKCREMDPVIDRLAAEGVDVRKVNVGVELDLTAKYHVEYLPTYILLENSEEANRRGSSADEASIREMLLPNSTPQ